MVQVFYYNFNRAIIAIQFKTIPKSVPKKPTEICMRNSKHVNMCVLLPFIASLNYFEWFLKLSDIEQLVRDTYSKLSLAPKKKIEYIEKYAHRFRSLATATQFNGRIYLNLCLLKKMLEKKTVGKCFKCIIKTNWSQVWEFERTVFHEQTCCVKKKLFVLSSHSEISRS